MSMSAEEYFKTKARMTDCCKIGCDSCPLALKNNNTNCDCDYIETYNYDKAISIVEQWGKEHPIKTRQSEFLKIALILIY